MYKIIIGDDPIGAYNNTIYPSREAALDVLLSNWSLRISEAAPRPYIDGSDFTGYQTPNARIFIVAGSSTDWVIKKLKEMRQAQVEYFAASKRGAPNTKTVYLPKMKAAELAVAHAVATLPIAELQKNQPFANVLDVYRLLKLSHAQFIRSSQNRTIITQCKNAEKNLDELLSKFINNVFTEQGSLDL